MKSNVDKRLEKRGPSPGPSDYKGATSGVDFTRRRSIGVKMGSHKRVFFTDIAAKNANPGAGAYKEINHKVVYKGAMRGGRYR